MVSIHFLLWKATTQTWYYRGGENEGGGENERGGGLLGGVSLKNRKRHTPLPNCNVTLICHLISLSAVKKVSAQMTSPSPPPQKKWNSPRNETAASPSAGHHLWHYHPPLLTFFCFCFLKGDNPRTHTHTITQATTINTISVKYWLWNWTAGPALPLPPPTTSPLHFSPAASQRHDPFSHNPSASWPNLCWHVDAQQSPPFVAGTQEEFRHN